MEIENKFMVTNRESGMMDKFGFVSNRYILLYINR